MRVFEKVNGKNTMFIHLCTSLDIFICGYTLFNFITVSLTFWDRLKEKRRVFLRLLL